MNRYGDEKEDQTKTTTFRKQSQLPIDLFAEELNVEDLRTSNPQNPLLDQHSSPEQPDQLQTTQEQLFKYQGPPTLGSYERVNHHAFEAQESTAKSGVFEPKKAHPKLANSTSENEYQKNQNNLKQIRLQSGAMPSPTDEYMGQGISQTTPLSNQHFVNNNIPLTTALGEGTTISSADKQEARKSDQQRALSQADLMASQISDVSSYRPGEFKKKYDKELHLMIDDLDIPNDSMTLSQISQSPWRGRSQRSQFSNLTASQRENIDLNAGEQGAPISGRLVSSPSQMTTGDMSQNGNGIGGQGLALAPGFLSLNKLELKNFNQSQDSQEEDLLPKMGKGHKNINYLGGTSADNMNHQQPTFKSIQERGSPAFARDFDDLTLSATDDDPANKSSTRGISIHPLKAKLGLEMSASTTQPFGLKQQFLRNQNRTFADSVIDHHASSQMAGSLPMVVKAEGSSQLGRTAFDGRSSLPFDREEDMDPTASISRMIYKSGIQPTGILVDDKPQRDRRISDDLSDLDILAQTQISNNLMAGALNSQNARSKLFARISNPSINEQENNGMESLGGHGVNNLESSDLREKRGPDSNEMSQFGKSNLTDAGGITKRTAHGLFAQFDDAESLNQQTPEKSSSEMLAQNSQQNIVGNHINNDQDEESAWMKSLLTQKDPQKGVNGGDQSQLNQLSDRFSSQSGSNNPLSQLKARIREQNIKKKVPLNQQVSSQNNQSLQQQQQPSYQNGQIFSSATHLNPLSNALSVNGSQNLARSASNIEQQSSNSDANNILEQQHQVLQMKDYLAQLEYQLKNTRTSQQETEMQNQTLKEQIALLEANLRRNTRQTSTVGNNSARSASGGPLSSAVSSSQGGNELLRARALEAAREENRELRSQVEELKASNERLTEGRISLEQHQRQQNQVLEKQMSNLKLNLDKQQIMVTSHKRDRDTAVNESERLRKETQERLRETEKKIENRVLDYENQLAQLGQMVNQMEQEALDAEKRIQQSLVQIRERDETIQNLDTACSDLKKELSVQRAKSQELDSELEIIRQSNVEKHSLNAQASLQAEQSKMHNFDNELALMKETHSKQVAQMREENLRLKHTLQEQASKSKALEMKNVELNKNCQMINNDGCRGTISCQIWKIIEKMTQTLSIENEIDSNESNFVTKMSELSYMKVIELVETAKMIENELEKVQVEATDTQKLLLQSQEQIVELQKQLQTKQETQKASMPSMSNFTRNLLEKRDKDVELAKSQVESIKKSLLETQNELQDSQNECLSFQNRIDLQQGEINQLKQAKQASENNFEELKTKLRDELIRHGKDSGDYQEKNQNCQDSQELKKVQEKLQDLTETVLGYEFVKDPLNDIELTLQSSFVDFYEQAKSHLESQFKLFTSQKDSNGQDNQQIIKLKEENSKLQTQILAQQTSSTETKEALESKLDQIKQTNQIMEDYLSQSIMPQFSGPMSVFLKKTQDTIEAHALRTKQTIDEKVKQMSDPAILESFSQEYADFMAKKQKKVESGAPNIAFVDLVEGQDQKSKEFTDFTLSHTDNQKSLSRQKSNPECLQLKKIPSLLSENDQKQISISARLSTNPVNFELQYNDTMQKLNQCEVELEAKNQMVKARNGTISDLKAELASLKNLQDQDPKINQQNVAQDLEEYKQRIMVEVKQKQSDLELEAEKLEKDRVNIETSLLKKKKECDTTIQNLSKEHEKIMNTKIEEIGELNRQVQDLTSKNEALSRSESMPLQSNGVSPSKLTVENLRLQTQIREKDREIKRLKDDLERQRKAHQDRIKQINEEFNETSHKVQEDMQIKQEETISKQKKIQEKMVEKVRADLRNQIDDLKNLNAKKEAEWQRERKKITQESESAVDNALKEFQEDQDLKIQATKAAIEKTWKRKLSDLQTKSEENVAEMNKIKEIELESVKEMIEFQTTEKVQQLITSELLEKNEHELAQMRTLHDQELKAVKEDFDKERDLLKDENIKLVKEIKGLKDKPQEKSTTLVEAQVQVSQNFTHYDLSRDLPLSPAAHTRKNQRSNHLKSQADEASKSVKLEEQEYMRDHSPPVSSNSSRNPLSSSGTCLCGASHSDAVSSQSPRRDRGERGVDIDIPAYLETQMMQRIEKVAREKYARELDKVRVDHASILAQNTTSSTKILQELVLLECEKILEFISFKAKTEQIGEDELNRRRTKINGMIKSTLESNSQLSNGKPNKQLKSSFDRCKKKISEVLAALKGQLEQRYAKRLESLAEVTSTQIANQKQPSQVQKPTNHLISQHQQLLHQQPDQIEEGLGQRQGFANRNQMIRVSSTSLIGHSVDNNLQGGQTMTPDKFLMPLGQATLTGGDPQSQHNNSNLNTIPLQSSSSNKPRNIIFTKNMNTRNNQGQTMVQESLHSEHFKMLQSREFATGYLAKNASQSLEAPFQGNHPYQVTNHEDCDEILSDEERNETRLMIQQTQQQPINAMGAGQSSTAARVGVGIDDGEVVIRGSAQTGHISEMFGAEERQQAAQNEEENRRGRALLNKIGPNEVNRDGAIVVEVQKVVRDLGMLHRTIKMAKFYRILLTGQQTSSQSGNDYQGANSIDFDQVLNQDLNSKEGQDRVVQTYRDLLNDFFKLISNLNGAIEQITQTSEVYKLRLLNVDLKSQMQNLRKETQGMVTRKRVEEILNHYQNDQRISEPTRKALDALEQSSFQISRTQFKMNQLADLFLGPKGTLNLQSSQVNSKCEDFAAQGGEFFESTLNNSSDRILDALDAETADAMSTNNYHTQAQQQKGAKKMNTSQLMPVQAEMLSPDETVQLLANVMQKMTGLNQTQTSAINQNLIEPIAHTTQTNQANLSIISNEDVIKQALQICASTQNANKSVMSNQMHHLPPNSQSKNLQGQQYPPPAPLQVHQSQRRRNQHAQQQISASTVNTTTHDSSLIIPSAHLTSDKHRNATMSIEAQSLINQQRSRSAQQTQYMSAQNRTASENARRTTSNQKLSLNMARVQEVQQQQLNQTTLHLHHPQQVWSQRVVQQHNHPNHSTHTQNKHTKPTLSSSSNHIDNSTHNHNHDQTTIGNLQLNRRVSQALRNNANSTNQNQNQRTANPMYISSNLATPTGVGQGHAGRDEERVGQAVAPIIYATIDHPHRKADYLQADDQISSEMQIFTDPTNNLLSFVPKTSKQVQQAANFNAKRAHQLVREEEEEGQHSNKLQMPQPRIPQSTTTSKSPIYRVPIISDLSPQNQANFTLPEQQEHFSLGIQSSHNVSSAYNQNDIRQQKAIYPNSRYQTSTNAPNYPLSSAAGDTSQEIQQQPLHKEQTLQQDSPNFSTNDVIFDEQTNHNHEQLQDDMEGTYEEKSTSQFNFDQEKNQKMTDAGGYGYGYGDDQFQQLQRNEQSGKQEQQEGQEEEMMVGSPSAQQLNHAQHNVNHLFEQLKSKFAQDRQD